MTTRYQEPRASPHFQGLTLPANPTSGTEDDFDDRDDEHVGDNEASVRAKDEGTETPEEFEVKYKDRLDDPADDYADDKEDRELMLASWHPSLGP
jgi:hypothetical protein